MLFLHVGPLPQTLSINAVTSDCQGGESAFGQMSSTLPTKWQPSKMKQTFLSTNLACLLAFERQAARPHHAVSVTPKLVNVVSLLGLINESHLSTLLQNVVQNVILSGKLSHRATCMQ